jgi:hypothetical protein
MARHSLWLAEDHLLHVTSTQFTETYKRFYLKDIQTIGITQTYGRRNGNIIIGLCTGFLISLFFLTKYYLHAWPPGVAEGFFGPCIGALLLFSAFNSLLGPTCICRLYTAVQVEELDTLGRVRTAKRAIRILKPLIESVQGKFSPENFDSAVEGAALKASAHALAETTSEPREQELRHETGTVHASLFGMILLGSLAGATEVLYKSPVKSILNLLVFLGVVVLVVFALTRQSRSDLPASIKRLTWIVLGLTIAEFLFSTIYGTIYMFTHAAQMAKTPPLEFRLEGPFYDGYCITSSAIELFLAVLGLALVRNLWKKEKTNRVPSTSQIVAEKE